MTALECFLYSNKRLDGRWQSGLTVLARSAGDPPDLALNWQVSEAADHAGGRGLLWAKSERGWVLALRRPIPTSRAGDQTTLGVIVPAEVDLDAVAALRGISALSPSIEWVQTVSEAATELGGPAPMPPMPRAHLVSGPLPDTASCRADLVTALVARMLTWWGSDWAMTTALDADASADVESYLAAALPLLPDALRRRVSFSTLERAVVPRIAVCGLVRALDSTLPDSAAVQLLDIRPGAPPAAGTSWDAEARALVEAAPWQATMLRPAATAADLRSLVRTVARIEADPTLAPDDVLAQWLQQDPAVLDRVDPGSTARVALRLPERFPADVLQRRLADPRFAAPYLAGLRGNVARIPDSSLSQLFDGADRDEVDRFLDDLLDAASRSDLHPGCEAPGCPVRQWFDRRVEEDGAFAARALAAGLQPDGIPMSHVAVQALQTGATPAWDLDAGSWAAAVPELLAAMPRGLLAERLVTATAPQTTEQVLRQLLERRATCAFGMSELLPRMGPAVTEPNAATSLLLASTSQVVEAYRLPRGVCRYATADVPDTRGYADPEVPVSRLGLRRSASDELQAALARVNEGVALPEGASGPPGGLAGGPTVAITYPLAAQLLQTRQGADLLLGDLLPALDPVEAKTVLLEHLDRALGCYGLQLPEPVHVPRRPAEPTGLADVRHTGDGVGAARRGPPRGVALLGAGAAVVAALVVAGVLALRGPEASQPPAPTGTADSLPAGPASPLGTPADTSPRPAQSAPGPDLPARVEDPASLPGWPIPTRGPTG